jgi:5-methylcytosine-specific restriction endonuclease McrA
MRPIQILKFIKTAEHPHFLSIDNNIYRKWKWIIRIFILMNKNYKSCEIFRKKYKTMENFVVIGLRYNGKNVKRRTSGFAKEFLEENKNCECIYCGTKLTKENATADHIVPISKGGNNTQINLIVCCKDCNSERGNLSFKTFMGLKNSKNKDKFI